MEGKVKVTESKREGQDPDLKTKGKRDNKDSDK